MKDWNQCFYLVMVYLATLYPKTLYLVVFINFNESYYSRSIRHLDIRSGEHIGLSPYNKKKIKPTNNSAVCDL